VSKRPPTVGRVLRRVLGGLLALAVVVGGWVVWDDVYPQLGPKTTAVCDITKVTETMHQRRRGAYTRFDYETRQCGRLWTRSADDDFRLYDDRLSARITYSTAPGKRGEILHVAPAAPPVTP
jgi:hypothetical protein